MAAEAEKRIDCVGGFSHSKRHWTSALSEACIELRMAARAQAKVDVRVVVVAAGESPQRGRRPRRTVQAVGTAVAVVQGWTSVAAR